MKLFLLLLLLVPTLLRAEDPMAECNSELYKYLSQEDDKHHFLNNKPKVDLLEHQDNREILSNAYAGFVQKDGNNYAIVGVDVTINGKKTTAYYLVKLNAALLVSSDLSPFYEVDGTFLGFSKNEGLLKKELSFLPFYKVKTKTEEELTVSLARLSAEKQIYKADGGDVSIDLFAAADILGYTTQKFIDDQLKENNKQINLADVKIGFRLNKGDKYSLSVYAGQAYGYTVSSDEGLVPRVNSSRVGVELQIKHTKKVSSVFLYEKRKVHTPTGPKKDDTFKVALQIKFRGFEYIWDDLKVILREMSSEVSRR